MHQLLAIDLSSATAPSPAAFLIVQAEHGAEFAQGGLFLLHTLCPPQVGHGAVQHLVHDTPRQSLDRLELPLGEIVVLGQFSGALLELLLAEHVGSFLELIDSGDGRQRLAPANERVGLFAKEVLRLDHLTLAHSGVLCDDSFEVIHIVGRDCRDL